MTSGSRTALFAKLHKVLKKHYKPVAIDAQRGVLEHLLFACLLEDAAYEDAEAAFAALVHTFFDWNEIRVTSIAELSEVMAMLPDPRAASHRLKRVLHAIFEASYSFDLEDKRKKNLGPTIKWFEKLDGCSHFAVAYIVQAALGGHAIPVDVGTMAILRLLDLVSAKDAESGNVPGMERAIAKSKGVEFAALLHQFGADYTANPYSPKIREILAEIEPASVLNLPKRRAPKTEKAPEKAEEKLPEKPAKQAKSEKTGKQIESEKTAKGEKEGKPDKVVKAKLADKSAADKSVMEKAAGEKPAKAEKGEKPAEKASGKAVPEKPAPVKPGKVAAPDMAGKPQAKKKPEPAKPAAPAVKPVTPPVKPSLPAKPAAQAKPAPVAKPAPPAKPAAPVEKVTEKKKPLSGAEKPPESKLPSKTEADKKKSPTAKLAKKKPR